MKMKMKMKMKMNKQTLLLLHRKAQATRKRLTEETRQLQEACAQWGVENGTYGYSPSHLEAEATLLKGN
jgi:hypothetical protein